MNVIFEYDVESDAKYSAWVTQAIGKALEIMNVPAAAEIGVLFTDDEGIRGINQEYRGLDSATDVLSFPLNERQEVLEKRFEINPETGDIMLGDIVISLETAQRQAQEYGHEAAREISYLTVHSMLHLLGYDHMQEEQKSEMRSEEEKILSALGLER